LDFPALLENAKNRLRGAANYAAKTKAIACALNVVERVANGLSVGSGRGVPKKIYGGG